LKNLKNDCSDAEEQNHQPGCAEAIQAHLSSFIYEDRYSMIQYKIEKVIDGLQ
jgi:hypothetical protein